MNKYKALACKLHNVSQDPIAIDWAEAQILLKQASQALDVLTDPATKDFGNYCRAQLESNLAKANLNSASYALDLSRMKERCAELMSQAKPLCDLEIDREKVRKVLHFVLCGRLE